MITGESGGVGTPQSPVGQHGHQDQVEAGTLGGLLGSFEAAAAGAGLDGGEPDDSQHIGSEGAGLPLGSGQTPAPTLQRLAHAPVPAGRILAGPFVGLGDSAGGQPHGSNAGAGTGAGGQVTRNGQRFRRERSQPHLAAPVGEESPLGAVDAPGVVGEDRLQRGSHGLVGSPQLGQGRGLLGHEVSSGSGGHGRVSSGASKGGFRQAKAAR